MKKKTEEDRKEVKKEDKEKKVTKKGEKKNMVRSFVSLWLVLFLVGCDDSNSFMGPDIVDYGTRTLELYSTSEQDKNGYYHYKYEGFNYGSIYFTTEPTTLVGWTSPDEFCIWHFNDYICEPVINYQTYSDEEGNGQQNFYINENAIGDTLTLIGFLNSDIYDEINVIIK